MAELKDRDFCFDDVFSSRDAPKIYNGYIKCDEFVQDGIVYFLKTFLPYPIVSLKTDEKNEKTE